MDESVSLSVLGCLEIVVKSLFFIVEAVVKFFLPTSWLRKEVKGQKVLITGAGGSIGKRLAQRFKDLGCDIVLWDVNGESIEQIAKEFQGKIKCKAYAVDLANREQVFQVADRVKKEFGIIDILVNNAGIGSADRFLDCPDQLLEKLVQINAIAHFWTAKAFLPDMVARNSGHIVSISSSAGLFGSYRFSGYSTSKFAAVGFDEALHNELYAMDKTGVHTTVVCPYFIKGGIADNITSSLPMLDLDETADRIMDAILCNQHMLVLPRHLYLAYFLKGILPAKALSVISKHAARVAVHDKKTS